MALEPLFVEEKLKSNFGDKLLNAEMIRDIFTIEIDNTINYDVISFLKNSAELNFHFLTDLCGIHYPENPVEKQFAIVYHMHNWIENTRIRIKTFLNGENPEIKSITNLFVTSNWMERETYDFYGINFTGHPQLKRILNMDEMVSFPMRKEYPMEDGGRTDKDDRFFGRIPQTNNVPN